MKIYRNDREKLDIEEIRKRTKKIKSKKAVGLSFFLKKIAPYFVHMMRKFSFTHDVLVIQEKIKTMASLSSLKFQNSLPECFETETRRLARSAGADDKILKEEQYPR